MGSVGGDDIGYGEFSRTTDFLTAPGRIYIAHHTHVAAAAAAGTNFYEAMVPTADYTTMDPFVDLPKSHVNDVLLFTITTSYEDAAIGTSVSKAMVSPESGFTLSPQPLRL